MPWMPAELAILLAVLALLPAGLLTLANTFMPSGLMLYINDPTRVVAVLAESDRRMSAEVPWFVWPSSGDPGDAAERIDALWAQYEELATVEETGIFVPYDDFELRVLRDEARYGRAAYAMIAPESADLDPAILEVADPSSESAPRNMISVLLVPDDPQDTAMPPRARRLAVILGVATFAPMIAGLVASVLWFLRGRRSLLVRARPWLTVPTPAIGLEAASIGFGAFAVLGIFASMLIGVISHHAMAALVLGMTGLLVLLQLGILAGTEPAPTDTEAPDATAGPTAELSARPTSESIRDVATDPPSDFAPPPEQSTISAFAPATPPTSTPEQGPVASAERTSTGPPRTAAGRVGKMLWLAIVVGGLEQAFWFAWSMIGLWVAPGAPSDDPGPWWEGIDEGILLGEPGAGFSLFATVSVQAAVVEELIFRACLFVGLRHWMSLWPAAILSGTIFGIVHGYGPIGLLSVSMGGAIYAVAYEWTRSIGVCIIAHAIHNASIFGLMMLIAWSVQ
ncbi:MAG: CPBP family glutamic-type intramembrane protease [Phycisphaerales bacterium]